MISFVGNGSLQHTITDKTDLLIITTKKYTFTKVQSFIQDHNNIRSIHVLGRFVLGIMPRKYVPITHIPYIMMPIMSKIVNTNVFHYFKPENCNICDKFSKHFQN